MRLLAIDASTRRSGAALLEARGGMTALVAEIAIDDEGSHASRLLPLVEELLATAGWSKSSLDAYAAARGPGSFTGIRVALGLIGGLALASGRKAVGVGTLRAMAEAHGPATGDRVPLLDAGRGDVYGARFDAASSPPVELRPAWVGDPTLAVEPGTALFVLGEGASVHEARLREAGYEGPIGPAPVSVVAAAGRIAIAELAAGTSDASTLVPLYVRPASAKARFA